LFVVWALYWRNQVILIFGEKIFSRGYDQYSLQAEVRLASDFIADEVRNVSEITLSEPDSPQTYNEIYYNANCIKFRAAGESPVSKTGEIIPSGDDLSFSIEQSGTQFFLVFTIDAAAGDNTFDITTKVLLNNVNSAVTGSDSSAIYFNDWVIYGIL
jgi:hypothetical protein